MKKTHISARDYEILVSGQGKTLDQVINNIGGNNEGDDLVPITIVTMDDIVKYISDTYKPSVVIPAMQKFRTLQSSDDIPNITVSFTNGINGPLEDIIDSYEEQYQEHFPSIDAIKADTTSYIMFSLSSNNPDYSLLYEFIVAHKIDTSITFILNNSTTQPSTIKENPDTPTPIVEGGGGKPQLSEINIGNTKFMTSIFVAPPLTLSKFNITYEESDDFSNVRLNSNLSDDTNFEAYMENSSKLIFYANINQ